MKPNARENRFALKALIARRACLGLLAIAGAASAGPVSERAEARALSSNAESAPRWFLREFIALLERDPRKFMRVGAALFAPERLRVSTVERSRAFDWSHRLAFVAATGEAFDPARASRKGASARFEASLRANAKRVIEQALLEDPSLLVRDGAVETVRRVLRMRPSEARSWGPVLEKAFLDERNHIEGEGLFIRETLLTALREGSLPLSKRIRLAAERDRNPRVKAVLRNWNTRAFDEMK